MNEKKEFQFFNPRNQKWTLWRDGRLVKTSRLKFEGVEIRGAKSDKSGNVQLNDNPYIMDY